MEVHYYGTKWIVLFHKRSEMNTKPLRYSNSGKYSDNKQTKKHKSNKITAEEITKQKFTMKPYLFSNKMHL